MVTREEIREGVANYIHLREQSICIYPDGSYSCQDDGCDNCTARAIMKYLHSQGVVIKGELPSVFNIDEEVMSALDYKKKLVDCFKPLVEKEKDD